MDRPDLNALLAKWQETLRLRDWQIEIDYAPNLASDGHLAHGVCWPFVHDRRARILLNDPKTPHGDDDPPVEDTLVHELLHLIFAPFSSNTPAEIALEEQAVWTITSAIRSGADREVVARAMAAYPHHDRNRKQTPMHIPTTARRADATGSPDDLATLTQRIAALEKVVLELLKDAGKDPGTLGKSAAARGAVRAPITIGGRTSRLPPDQARRMAERMGTSQEVTPAIRQEGANRIYSAAGTFEKGSR